LLLAVRADGAGTDQKFKILHELGFQVGAGSSCHTDVYGCATRYSI
jgi:hypothetical protein